MALTATATERVQHDVRQQLCIPRCVVFKSSFNRPNLRCAALRPPGPRAAPLPRAPGARAASAACPHRCWPQHRAPFSSGPPFSTFTLPSPHSQRYFVRKKGKSAAQDIGELLTKK
jgi:hypothetical protein